LSSAAQIDSLRRARVQAHSGFNEEGSVKARVKVGVALTATLGLLSGCGGGSSSDQTANFKKSFSSVANQFQQTSHAIGTAIEQAPSHTDAQLAATFRGLANRWQTQASRLGTLKPPSNLATDFNALTAATTRAEADLTAIAAAAQTHSSSAAKQAAATLITDITSAKSASTTLTNKLAIK
jgi:hypothetical protein